MKVRAICHQIVARLIRQGFQASAGIKSNVLPVFESIVPPVVWPGWRLRDEIGTENENRREGRDFLKFRQRIWQVLKDLKGGNGLE